MDPKPEIAWESEYDGPFLNVCVDLRRLGIKPGTPDWLETLKAWYGIDQYKNRWDSLVKQWKALQNLVKSIEMECDPETKKLIASSSDQDCYKYLEVGPVEGKKLPPPDVLHKLKKIFEGCNVDGEHEDAGPSNRHKKRIRPRELEEEEEDQEDGGDNLPTHQITKPLWSTAAHELLVDLLVEETRKRKKHGSHSPRETWGRIRQKINESTGNAYTRKQLKNHRDVTRRNWRSWCRLVSDPTMKWDPITRTFGATYDDWTIHLEKNRRAYQFQKKVIPCLEKLAIIFKGDTEPGAQNVSHRDRRVQGPSEQTPQLHEPTPLPTLNLNEPVVTGNEDNGDTPISTLIEDDMLMLHLVPPMNYEYTIGECIELLDGLEKIERGSDLYLFALDLFLESERRETFVQLEEPSLRMTWLLYLQANNPIVLAP